MPGITGLLRRRGLPSDSDLRRHSFYAADSSSAPALPHRDTRVSEQIPRPSHAEFLSPSTTAAGAPVITRTSTDNMTRVEEHAGSPVKEDHTNTKFRRFSMIRSRHASDSHLSARARMHAQADAPVVPHRVFPYSPTCPTTLTLFCSSSDYDHCTDNGYEPAAIDKEEIKGSASGTQEAHS